MTKTWEDITWEEEKPLKEWVIEYVAKVGNESSHHLTILYGEEMEDVQRLLMHELRTTYMEASEIEVTVLRMEVIDSEPNAYHFAEEYTP
jgi:hypothetical protein